MENLLDCQPEWLKDRTIYLCVSGSKAYGTDLPDSDTDYRGVCIPPVQNIFGMQGFEQATSDNRDVVVFGIKKFFKLCRDANPNTLETLFVRDQDVLCCDGYGQTILDYRHLFLSQRVIYTYSGYAHSQLQRVKNHKKWIDNPITNAPQKSDFEHLYRISGKELKDALGEVKFDQTGFEAAKKEKAHYDQWRANRNPERFELEQKHGIDLKHCMHLIRLLKQGLELVRDGWLNVYRESDRDELIGIRNGAMSYGEILKYSADLNDKIMSYKDRSPLPKKPNDGAINDLLIELTENYLARHS